MPRFTHPGAGQTVYFLLTDRFANGSTANDTGGYAGGPDQTGFDPTRLSHYHGGDFAGLMAKLDYIKGLGATAVWVTPPFKNKPMQESTAGYHGYWILDFLQIDPHLGSNAEFAEFVRQAHARGLKVYMDIIVNHTADVIQYEGGNYTYRPKKDFPYRDAQGRVLDDHAAAYNGLGDPAAFPALSAVRSFPYVPTVPAAEKNAKNPAWLNDVTLYHNRGNSTFQGENAVYGDFGGLDDVFTEQPRVVQGFIDLFSEWLKAGVDGYRIDTARHVNSELSQAFSPAIRARARALGRPDFIQFGEVYNEAGDPAVLSEFSTEVPLDATLDFGFFAAARKFVSQVGTASTLADFFARDDYYTDHDSNVHSTTTFLGNHDAGRFAYFLQRDNPGASPAQLADLVKLGHGLMLLSRGQPVVYYGDEQGMIGRGGNDMQAREDMFASQTPDFKTAPLLGTTRTGADDKFDPSHPIYHLISRLDALRAAHPALRTGAMIPRATRETGLFAFSRIGRVEKTEYLVALNNSRTATLSSRVPTSQRAGAHLVRIFDSRTPDSPGPDTLITDEQGQATVSLAPLQFAVWQATTPLMGITEPVQVALVNPAPGAALKFTVHEFDGQTFASRQEIRAEVTGSDGFGEVTFTLERASRPGQTEYLGTDDAPPYRVFWRPSDDLGPGEKFTVTATFNDLRGRRASASVEGLSIASKEVPTGIVGAKVPTMTTAPASVTVRVDEKVTLRVTAEGTGPLEYQWLRNDEEVTGATDPTLTITASSYTGGSYRALVRNRAGTTLSRPAVVSLLPAFGRIDPYPEFPSKLVPSRRVEVWLPPGYDEEHAARFPVLYMHDGQNVFTTGTGFGGSTWEVDRALQKLMGGKKARPAIIVAIWNTGMGRFAEYMPAKAVASDTVEILPGAPGMPTKNISSDAYLKFIVGELKPFIDRTYRTQPGAPDTCVMGSSMGGLISVYALCEYPQVFGGAGCVSTHFPAGKGAGVDYLAKHLPKPGANKLWFDYGTETLDALYEPYQRRADAAMKAAGYTAGRDWITKKFPGAEHSERSWRVRVDQPLEFLLGPPSGS
ncbi:MAG: alpha-amylase family glycosyl hydrolase [Opitutales bacterium]|nr:alpha-amylase family glycosyl hydrolase [Opitutales bacterium]